MKANNIQRNAFRGTERVSNDRRKAEKLLREMHILSLLPTLFLPGNMHSSLDVASSKITYMYITATTGGWGGGLPGIRDPVNLYL
jgi:hypothetical protein